MVDIVIQSLAASHPAKDEWLFPEPAHLFAKESQKEQSELAKERKEEKQKLGENLTPKQCHLAPLDASEMMDVDFRRRLSMIWRDEMNMCGLGLAEYAIRHPKAEFFEETHGWDEVREGAWPGRWPGTCWQDPRSKGHILDPRVTHFRSDIRPPRMILGGIRRSGAGDEMISHCNRKCRVMRCHDICIYIHNNDYILYNIHKLEIKDSHLNLVVVVLLIDPTCRWSSP